MSLVVESGLTPQRIIAELTKSPHGELKEYESVGKSAVAQDPDFFAHLVAWNALRGAIRDAKIALPVLALSGQPTDVYRSNALAHIVKLDFRSVLRACSFARDIGAPVKPIRKAVTRRLRALENDTRKWTRTALQHRRSMKSLYAQMHIKPAPWVDQILFKGHYPAGSAFAAVKQLATVTPMEAGRLIAEFRIPFLVASGILGEKSKDPDLLLALIERMSPTELVTNMQRLERMGVKAHAVTRAALEQALSKVAASKQNTLKTTKAMETVEDEGMRTRLKAVQEKQIANLSVDGDWLILADKSSSMHTAIEVARVVAGSLTKFVKGQVHLVFFNSEPQYVSVTGLDYDQILERTRGISANGVTSIGCGVKYMRASQRNVDGIAIVSDGDENTAPSFSREYAELCKVLSKDIPVYYFRMGSPASAFAPNIDVQEFEIGRSIDHYSIPNLVATMRTNRYALTEEIMGTPLLTLEETLA